MDCDRKGERIDAPELGDGAHRRPRVAPYACDHGFQAAHTLPLRVRHQTLGAVNLLLGRPGSLDGGDCGRHALKFG
ncbi:hypothetical protein [Streptomyces sp. NPDC048419]|uniref:hypothetical protein n=1 Tax=Streptomyces sp. NPDC048419 TaxID=3365547 RepID=UPI00370F82C2